MRIRHATIIALVIGLVATAATTVFAAPDPDRFPGDTAIYTQRAAEVSANVLFIIDNSAAAANIAAGSAYDPSVTYTGDNLYLENAVYEADNQGDFPTTPVLTDIYNLACASTTSKDMIIDTLTSVGTYSASGSTTAPNIKKGKCDLAPKGATYAIGNYLNYLTETPPQPERVWELDSDGVTKLWFEVARKHFSLIWAPPSSGPTDGDGNPLWVESSEPAVLEKPIEDYAWKAWNFYTVEGLPQIELIYNAIRLVTGGYRFAGVNFGAMEYGANNKGGQIVFPISPLTDPDTFDDFLAAIPQDPSSDLLSSSTARPATGTFMDAIAYFQGEDFPIIQKTNPYPSPITLRCQPNFIIYITNGMNNENLGSSDFAYFEAMRIPIYDDQGNKVNEIGAQCGDVDQDGAEESGRGRPGPRAASAPTRRLPPTNWPRSSAPCSTTSCVKPTPASSLRSSRRARKTACAADAASTSASSSRPSRRCGAATSRNTSSTPTGMFWRSTPTATRWPGTRPVRVRSGAPTRTSTMSKRAASVS